MIKRLLPWAIALVVVLGAIVVWRRTQATARAAGPAFRLALVQRGDVAQTVSASGTLSAITTVEVGSQVSGLIQKMYVDFNSTVKSGQLIAEIEPSTYESKLVQAEGDLASAKATLELKQVNAKRAEELKAKQLVSPSDYDQTVSELHQQQATVRIKEAALRSAQVDVDRCKIRSPIDGVVISRDVDTGQTVQASFSAPQLFTLAKDLREMQITASVSEADIGGVEAGQSVSFTVDAFSGRTFTGKVREVRNNPTTTNNVVNYYTIIDVSNADLKLRPGMTANVTITIARRSGVLRVANSALRFKAPDTARVIKAADEAGTAATPAPEEDNGGGPNLDQMPAEIRERILADFDKNKDGKLDASERSAMREQMKARFGGDGPPAGGFGGGAGAAGTRRPAKTAATSETKTVYVLANHTGTVLVGMGDLVATTVKVGLSDSANTEILSGLPEGAALAVGISTQAAVVEAAKTNPFMPKPPGPAPKGP